MNRVRISSRSRRLSVIVTRAPAQVHLAFYRRPMAPRSASHREGGQKTTTQTVADIPGPSAALPQLNGLDRAERLADASKALPLVAQELGGASLAGVTQPAGNGRADLAIGGPHTSSQPWQEQVRRSYILLKTWSIGAVDTMGNIVENMVYRAGWDMSPPVCTGPLAGKVSDCFICSAPPRRSIELPDWNSAANGPVSMLGCTAVAHSLLGAA
jgi:hypothetical protein